MEWVEIKWHERGDYVIGMGIGLDNSHLVAHTLTAALSTTCLQFNPAPLTPLSAPRMLGQAGLMAPAAAAACRARIVGKYRLSAVHER